MKKNNDRFLKPTRLPSSETFKINFEDKRMIEAAARAVNATKSEILRAAVKTLARRVINKCAATHNILESKTHRPSPVALHSQKGVKNA